MSFLYEKVGEENLELIESLGFKDWGMKSLLCYPNQKWCIDKDNKVYFVPIGSFRGESPFYADMSYLGKIIRLEIHENTVDVNKVVLAIDRIQIPKSVWGSKEEVLGVALEACKQYVLGKAVINNLMVEVNVAKEPECVEVDYNGR